MHRLPDDGRTEEAEKVTATRELEARNELLRHGSTTDHVAALDHSDGEATAGQVSGSYQAVVSATNDNRVPFPVLQSARRGGEASSPHNCHSGINTC